MCTQLTALCSLPRSLLLHGAAQLASLLSWRALPASETAQRALSVLTVLSFYLLPTAAPRLYLRWRTQALLANRLVFFAFPLLRKPRGGGWASLRLPAACG